MNDNEKKFTWKQFMEKAKTSSIFFRFYFALTKGSNEFMNKGLNIPKFDEEDEDLDKFSAEIMTASLLCKLGRRSKACTYLLRSTFLDFYSSLESVEEKEDFSYLIYRTLEIFD